MIKLLNCCYGGNRKDNFFKFKKFRKAFQSRLNKDIDDLPEISPRTQRNDQKQTFSYYQKEVDIEKEEVKGE